MDYKEVFAPVARIETISLVISLTSKSNWSLYHLDVKSAFLNDPLGEEIFVTQPPSFEQKGKEKLTKKAQTQIMKGYPKLKTVGVGRGVIKCSLQVGTENTTCQSEDSNYAIREGEIQH